MLADEFSKSYFLKLSETIKQEYQTNTIYPDFSNIFNAFTLCPFTEVKVVILGQDPYHGAGQAHGLAFSVCPRASSLASPFTLPENIKTPPSLQNIYKEIKSDLGKEIPQTGNLEHWARQGVLLLNTTLTVKANTPMSHAGLGWETFTDAVIKNISEKKEHVVFLIWGKHAQTKSNLINQTKHLILKAPHPSPFSAHKGFFGCQHFSKTNQYLIDKNKEPIEW